MMINGIPIVKKNLPINIKDLLDIFQSENNITKEYRKYRFNSKTLIWKIMAFYLKDDVLLEAARIIEHNDPAIKRFITFFQFYKMHGIEVIPFSFT